MSSSSSSDDDDEWVLSNISSAEDGCGDNERGEQDGDGQPAVQACKRKVTAIGQGHTSSYRGET